MFYLFAIPMLPFLCFALSAQPGQYTSTRDTVSDAREAAILNERKCVNPFRIFDGKLVDLRPVCAGIHAGNDKDTRFAFTASTGIEYMSGQILQVRDGGVLFQQGQRLDFIDHFPLAGTVDKMWATCFAKRVGEYT